MDLRQLVDSLKERLQELHFDDRWNVREPFSEEQIDQIRAWYAPRHLPEELVDFYRLGPVSPVKVWDNPQPIGFDDDADWLEQASQADWPGNTASPLSPRWVLFTAGERDGVFSATTPVPSEQAAIILWDNAPTEPQPMFPSLKSALWFWNEIAQRMLTGELVDDREVEGWSWDLIYPDRAIEPSYRNLRDLAVQDAVHHPGWVFDQPIPQDGRWTIEWATALGVADLDVEN